MISRYEALRRALEMAQHNVTAYGTNWGAAPKAGYEAEWQQAKEEAEIFQAMMNEISCYCRPADEVAHLYVGTVDEYEVRRTWDGKGRYVENVEIETKQRADSREYGGQKHIFHMDKDTADTWILSGRMDEERHRRYDEGKDHFMRIWVNGIGYIFRLEWED